MFSALAVLLSSPRELFLIEFWSRTIFGPQHEFNVCMFNEYVLFVI